MHRVELDGVFLGIPFRCHCNGQGLAGDSEELGLGRFQLSVVQVYFKASWGIRVEILGNQRGAGTKEQQTTPQQEQIQSWSWREQGSRNIEVPTITWIHLVLEAASHHAALL